MEGLGRLVGSEDGEVWLREAAGTVGSTSEQFGATSVHI